MSSSGPFIYVMIRVIWELSIFNTQRAQRCRGERRDYAETAEMSQRTRKRRGERRDVAEGAEGTRRTQRCRRDRRDLILLLAAAVAKSVSSDGFETPSPSCLQISKRLSKPLNDKRYLEAFLLRVFRFGRFDLLAFEQRVEHGNKNQSQEGRDHESADD